jgi:hypothetical protein
MLKEIVMKRQDSKRQGSKCHGSRPAKTARKLSDAILITRYLDLQRLRDEVRRAEARFAPASLKKASLSQSASGSAPHMRKKGPKVVDFHSGP